MKQFYQFTLLSFLTGMLYGASAHAENLPPTNFVRSNHEAASRLLGPRGPKDENVREQKLRELFSDFLSYNELAERALEDHWPTLSPNQRTEFVNLLTQLIERNYQRKLKRTLDFKIVYQGQDTKNNEIIVHTLAKPQKQKRNESVALDYTLKSVGNRWTVVDIATDGVSLVRNYRSQFNRIIRKHGWLDLVRRMRERLNAGNDFD